jgi:hypothetical protein
MKLRGTDDTFVIYYHKPRAQLLMAPMEMVVFRKSFSSSHLVNLRPSDDQLVKHVIDRYVSKRKPTLLSFALN